MRQTAGRPRSTGWDPADPHDRAVRVATQAHRSYSDLVKAYDARGYDPRVARITG